jgi:hypothetical protein
MSKSRPFAYNTGSAIPGTDQVGDIAIATDITQPYAANYGGVQWWAGPDEDLGYVICKPISAGNQPNPLNIPCYIGFERSDDLTDQSFIDLANTVFPGNNFSTAAGAKSWMDTNGYWSSYVGGTGSTGGTGDFNVTITQVGNDVVWSGSGKFNLTELTSAGPNTMGGGFQANQAVWAIGPLVTIDQYSGTITYPTSFGSGGTTVTSNTGQTFGILPGGSGRLLYVPSGYTSNSVISGTSTYANQTIAGMGLTPGTYTWSWGSGGNSSTLVMTIG